MKVLLERLRHDALVMSALSIASHFHESTTYHLLGSRRPYANASKYAEEHQCGLLTKMVRLNR